MPHPRVITLTSDFGLADHFVGVMRGVILRINPEARLVDISHEVDSYDILDGAFTLAQSYRFFPPGTIHLVVVDPGVGSARRPILVTAPSAQFVAPDNGVLSMIYEREPDAQVRHITRERYFLRPVSNTFHGRDIFAPVAGWLSKGVEPGEFGKVVTDYVRLALLKRIVCPLGEKLASKSSVPKRCELSCETVVTRARLRSTTRTTLRTRPVDSVTSTSRLPSRDQAGKLPRGSTTWSPLPSARITWMPTPVRDA